MFNSVTIQLSPCGVSLNLLINMNIIFTIIRCWFVFSVLCWFVFSVFLEQCSFSSCDGVLTVFTCRSVNCSQHWSGWPAQTVCHPTELCQGMGTRLSASNHQGHSVLDRGPAPPPPSTAGWGSPVSACQRCKVKRKLLMLEWSSLLIRSEVWRSRAMIMIKWNNADVNSAELQPDFHVRCSLDEIVTRSYEDVHLQMQLRRSRFAIRGSCRLRMKC